LYLCNVEVLLLIEHDWCHGSGVLLVR
jgi:hypothetical protein